MELLKKRLANLLCVKSILTLVVTAVFAHQVVVGNVGEDFFRTVFVMIVTFYFSAQAEKKAEPAVQVVEQSAQPEQAANG